MGKEHLHCNAILSEKGSAQQQSLKFCPSPCQNSLKYHYQNLYR